MRKMDIGMFVAIIVAVAAGIYYLGGLNRRIADLESRYTTPKSEIRKETGIAIQSIKDAYKKVLSALNETVASLESQHNMSGNGLILHAGGKSVSTNQVLFSLQKCYFEGNILICDLYLVSENSNSRPIKIPNSTRAVDDSGSEFYASIVRIGSSEGSSVTMSLPNNVRTKAQFEFPNIPKGTKKIALLDIRFYCERWDNARIRDIPIAN